MDAILCCRRCNSATAAANLVRPKLKPAHTSSRGIEDALEAHGGGGLEIAVARAERHFGSMVRGVQANAALAGEAGVTQKSPSTVKITIFVRIPDSQKLHLSNG